MKKLALMFTLALATTTPAFARAGGGGCHGGFLGGGMHTGRSVVTSIEVAAMAMATVTTDITAIILIMVTTVLILEPQLASVF